MAGKGGGAWKVAYADFVTAMMAFFMVMWLLSQDAKVKDAVALHFRNPYGQFAVGDSLMAPRHQQHFKDRVKPTRGSSSPAPETTGPKTRKPYTLTLHRGDRTIVGTVVTFSADATELNDTARDQLQGFIPRIHGKPQKIEIRGHALRRASQSTHANNEPDPWKLSYERCINTMTYLVEQGISPERLRLSQAGAFEPYTLGDQPDQLANNSRVDVYLLNEVAEDANGSAEEREERFKSHGEASEKPAAISQEAHAEEHATHAPETHAPAAHEPKAHSH
jgi:chemotaxis protein MotB